MGERKPFLLLNPPSTVRFCRRNALREKDSAQAAAFPSIDLILLSGAIREAGYEPKYIDASLDRITWSELTEKLRGPNWAGMVSATSSSRIEEELAGLRELKETLGDAPTFIVGTITLQQDKSRLAGILEANPWLDGIILNTAEHNFGEWITADRPDSVAPFNIAVRDRRVQACGPKGAALTELTIQGGSAIVVPEVKVRYGNSLRIPRPEHRIFKDARCSFPQSKHGPVTCVQLSFGCPFTCEFCVDNQQYRKMLYRDVDDMVGELVEIERLGFREVYFKDLTFGLNRKITDEFLAKLIERRLKLRWLCTTRIDVASRDLLQLMRQAGCYGIEFGIEHAHEEVRHRIDKKVSEERIRRVLTDCRALGIETTAFVMLAFEDDTEQDVRDTIRFARALRPDYVSFNLVNALPGTEYERRARREGFLLERPNDYSFATSNIRHRHLAPHRVGELFQEATRSFYLRPAHILRKLWKTRSLFELRKLMRLGRSVAFGG